MTKIRRYSIFILLLMIAASGCSRNVPLGGKVTFSDDGSPLAMGFVCFETDSFMARGMIGPDGTYRLGSLSERDGLPPGKYHVYIIGALKEIGVSKDSSKIFESLIDEKLTDVQTTDLSCEVTASTKKFDIQVERYQPKK